MCNYTAETGTHVHKISLQVIWIFRVGRVSERAFRPATCQPTCWSTVDMSPDVLERFRQRQNLVRPAHRHDGVIQFSDWLNANVPSHASLVLMIPLRSMVHSLGHMFENVRADSRTCVLAHVACCYCEQFD